MNTQCKSGSSIHSIIYDFCCSLTYLLFFQIRTEEVTGVDLVQAQLKIAGGATLEEAGLIQDNITARGVAIQCRITTENPEKDFAPVSACNLIQLPNIFAIAL